MVRNVGRARQKETRKEQIDFHVNTKTTQDCGKPIDYSFRNLRSFYTKEIIKVRFVRMRELPQKINQTQFLTRSVWFGNNGIQSIAGMDLFLKEVIHDSQYIGWLDLAFNKIRKIDEVILKFPNLVILYMHGNLIEDFQEIVKLRALKHLRSVTFSANPISKFSHYRRTILTLLPQIVNLDQSSVLKSERSSPIPVESIQIAIAANIMKKR